MKSKKLTLDKKWFIIIFSISIFLLHIPLHILKPVGGLDPSWQLGLKWADLKDLSFGSDIVFTYGPLHFLHYGSINIGHYPSLLYETALSCFTYFIIIFLFIYQFSNRIYKKPWKDYSSIEQILIILGLAFLAFIPVKLAESILVLSCMLFIQLIFKIESNKTNRKKYLSNIILNVILLNIICLIKFSYTIATLTLIGIAIFGLIYQKKAKFIIYFLILFALFNISFWLLCGQSLLDLPGYYFYGFEISSGYTEAMQINNYANEIHFGIFALLVLAILACFSLLFFFVKKDFYHAFSLFILLPILFMSFKEGFVRPDGHVIAFFSQLFPIILAFILFFTTEDVPLPYKRILQLFTILIIPITASVIVHKDQRNWASEEKCPSLCFLFPNTERIKDYKQSIRDFYPPLPLAFLEQNQDKKVDIIPWDISLLFAYDLNWSPRPVIQSYSAYTPTLDSLNTQHFRGNQAPDNVVYYWMCLNKYYPLFEEPIVFRTLLENYNVQQLDNHYLILQHQKEKRLYDYTQINSGVGRIGTPIDVPQLPGQHIYCKLKISTNLFGKVANLLYKSTHVKIQLFLKGQTKPVEYIFKRRLGLDGFFISKHATGLHDVYDIFGENYEQDIEKIKIEVHPNIFHKQDIEYEFYSSRFMIKK